MAGLSAPTLYNIFLYEYTHIKIQVAPPQMWQETSMADQWRELWESVPNREKNILAIAWMLGWEDVINYKTPVALAGSMPLRTIAGLIDLTNRYQSDLQACPPTTLTPYFQFHSFLYPELPKDSEVAVGYHEEALAVSRGGLTPANIKKALDILSASIANRIFGGANLMVAASRALAHAKKVMEKKEYVAFNPADFSLPNVFTKEERIRAELVFNYTSQLEPTESGEIPARDLAEPSVGTGTTPPPNSPTREQDDPPRVDRGKRPIEEMPPPPEFEIPVPIVQPPLPRTFLISRTVLQQCTTIHNLPDEEKPGFEPKSPLDPAVVEETPFELIEDQPEWRQQYLRNVETFNRYYDAPTHIRILPEFDPRPTRRDEWAQYHTDLLHKYVNWPIISPEHLHFKNTSTTRIVINNFISKYATSPDPSIRKTVLNLRLLDILLVDNLITVDAHMEPLNVNPNAPLPPYTDNRLYIRAVTYGSGATSLFESWATEKFLIGMKDLYKPVSITSRSRPEFLNQFVRTCLRQKKTKSPPTKKSRLP